MTVLIKGEETYNCPQPGLRQYKFRPSRHGILQTEDEFSVITYIRKASMGKMPTVRTPRYCIPTILPHHGGGYSAGYYSYKMGKKYSMRCHYFAVQEGRIFNSATAQVSRELQSFTKEGTEPNGSIHTFQGAAADDWKHCWKEDGIQKAG